MKFIGCTFVFSVCIFFMTACENAGPSGNAVLNENKTADNRNISAGNTNISNTALAENSNRAANTGAGTPAETGEFEGTSGITDKKHAIKSAAVLKTVRTAAHDGYDRAVFEFAGAEMPSYHIEYIDRPVRACGSGNVVPLKGDGWLEIRFQPAAAHTEAGEPTVENREYAPNHKIIKELKLTCDFEADVTWVLGVSSPNRYRVLELENPTRLAVDIKH